jgi:SWI/SNF-related matrix-associated actin-dependent regulator of chromatin subfamily A member 5
VELYSFQQEDLDKIIPTKRGANGGEMGTGKTPFAVKAVEAWYEELTDETKKNVYGDLVVAPLNTFDGWQKRFSEWTPDVDVVTMPRSGQPTQQRAWFLDQIRNRRGDVFLTHWESLRLMPELRRYVFSTIVADEAHRMSNRKNQQTLALKMLQTYHKLPMSGTLSADHPAGLWSPLHWLYPSDRFVTSYWRFYKTLVTADKHPAGYDTNIRPNLDNVHLLHEFMDPFYVRHLKREQCCPHHPKGVMPWLKPVTYDRIYIDLSPRQRRVYEQMQKDMLSWVGEHEDSPLAAQVVMVQMLRLSQMALATPNIVGDKVILELPSAKLDRGMELFKDHPEKPFLAYTSSKQFLNIAVAECNKRGISAMGISGDVNKDGERNRIKNAFIAGDFQVLFCMIQAAEGIDGLQDATDTAVFFDRTWSSRMNHQAEDRLDRDGQKHGVQIIDIMARNTVDLGRHTRLEKKWEWLKLLLNMKVDQETGA